MLSCSDSLLFTACVQTVKNPRTQRCKYSFSELQPISCPQKALRLLLCQYVLKERGWVQLALNTTRIYCKKTAECTFHNPRAGTLSKLFSSSEALLVFFLYGQTLYTAIIFPDGDEHVYRWTEQFWSEIWKKKVKPGNVIKKLNLSEVNVSDPDLMSSLQLLFCHFVYDKIDDKTSYPWMIHRWIFLFWISTQEHVLNHGMCSAGNLHD